MAFAVVGPTLSPFDLARGESTGLFFFWGDNTMETSRSTAAPSPFEPAQTLALKQRYDDYTTDDHEAWRRLFTRRVASLHETGSRAVLDGIQRIGLSESSIPRLDTMNAQLSAMTGWRAVPTAGFLEPGAFFSSLGRREFPTTVHVRPLHSLEYVPEPDIFHDVFGHVPMHSDPVFADALQRIGALGAIADQQDLVLVKRFFWFTVEFGLVNERGTPRLYGSGLVSSIGEEENALHGDCELRPFRLNDVLGTDFDHSQVQPVLFVIDSFEQLLAEIRVLEGEILARE
ncbi:MAG: phenylalanine 4-monooxygenase [Gemmatimonadota bacterium]